jgi:hypothetical protein
MTKTTHLEVTVAQAQQEPLLDRIRSEAAAHYDYLLTKRRALAQEAAVIDAELDRVTALIAAVDPSTKLKSESRDGEEAGDDK